MEQHPVPQNITSFQFRLIGDMTIKQFGYLAGGVILAFIFYKLPLPFFFTWPLAIVAALGGFGFAFVPIEERPMDIWVFSFLKNVYSPTVFHWEHTDPTPEPSKTLVPPPAKIPNFSLPQFPIPIPGGLQKTPANKPAAHTTEPPKQAGIQPAAPRTALQHPSPTAGAKKSSPLDSLFFFIDNLFVTKPKSPPAYVVQPQARPKTVASPPPAAPQPVPQPQPVFITPSVTGTKVESVQPAPVQLPTQPQPQPGQAQERAATEEIESMKKHMEELQKKLHEKSSEDQRVLELQKQLSDLMTERQRMEGELIALRTKAQTAPAAPVQQPKMAGVVEPQRPAEPTIKMMNPDVATRAGLPRLTTFPNVVTGIIKDYDNNLLPGVLVTVKDKEGVPLRALKTNKLGQFAASTQLSNGTYVVEVEDPRERFVFDRVQITINGTVLPALQIIAKSKRSMDREKLAREIFSAPSANT